MQQTNSEIEVKERGNFPWIELALYLVGGLGLFVLASAGLGALHIPGGQWSVVAIVLCNAAFLGGSAWYLGVLRKSVTWDGIGIFPIRWRWSWLWIALGISLALMPLRGMIGLLVSYLVEGGLQTLQNRADVLFGAQAGFSWIELIIRLVGVGMIVPMSEELYFRGMLHRLFQPYLKFWPRVLLSSAIFALAHFDSAGVAVSSFIMAVAIAIAYERTKSLWLPIAIHMTTNSIAVFLIYVAMALQNSPLMNTMGY